MALSTNLAVYWGQNSYGAANPSNTAAWQQPIEYYCGDNTIDTLPIAFLTEFYSTGNLPTIDLANICSTANDPVFPGTSLPNCSFLATGIETCQKAGKIVTLSIGGATGGVGFTNNSEGQAYAQVIWDIFLGGSSTTRPFGAAVLDGIDMDIEGGAQTGYTAFLTALRTLMNGGNKQYYITAAPQCPYPDAYIGTTLNAFGFDAVYVQFYNNYCELSNFGNTNDWDFGTWDNWATTVSPNRNVKVYIGAPASSTAANNGYVSASTLATIISQTKRQYASFGGVMLWDASQAYANGRDDHAVKSALTGASPPVTTTSSTFIKTATSTSLTKTTTRFTTTRSIATTSGSSAKPTALSSPAATATTSGGPCAGVSAWSPTAIYVAGDQVTYNGQLWTAQWWTEDTAPGGTNDGWSLVGSC
ncbi:glycoside hydrolase family 18 protein [Chiua virens]|nr:glycoside hydrolase family 18 protein [Chiua virens]